MGRRLIAISGIALAAACLASTLPAQDLPPPTPVGDPGEPLPPPESTPSAGDGAMPPFGAFASPADPGSYPAFEPSPAPGADDPLAPDPVGGFDESSPGLAPQVDPGVAPAANAPASKSAANSGSPAIPYALPPEQLRSGAQAVGVTVKVLAPRDINLHQESTLKIVVTNTGSTPALGVEVFYLIPEALEVVETPQDVIKTGVHLIWKVDTLAPGAERTLPLRVKAVKVGMLEHAASVVVRAGTKESTHVKQPLLKVEQSPRSRTVLKGTEARFDIRVSNPGTGPARNVLIQAKLSDGLRHEQGEHIQLLLPVLESGHQVDLDPLIADAVAGSMQSCTVTVSSPDVPQPTAEAVSKIELEVVEPMLDLKISGPDERYTDTIAMYTITVKNPGTAAAQGVRVGATIPLGGVPLPDATVDNYGRTYDPKKRLFLWNIPQLNHGEEVNLEFAVRLGGLTIYKITTEARASRPIDLSASAVCSTHVAGMAEIHFEVTEPRRVLDVGEETTYEVRIHNGGSKDATNLLVRAELSEHLKVASIPQNEAAKMPPEARDQIAFDPIARLAPKGDILLKFNVKAVAPGVGSCRVNLFHDDLQGSFLSQSAVTRVTQPASAALHR